jgi:antibiotic biosynthesis monooxygenase (ABM) superfamily enzyme
MSDEKEAVVISTHRVIPGRMASFSTSVKGLLSAASRSQGYLDGRMEKASGDSATWLVICWFDSAESAAEWDGSRSHATWREYVGRFSSRVEPPRPASAPPAAGPPKPPPKWKTALVTLIGVFPAVLLVNVTVIPRVTGLPLLARTLVLCVCVTGLMTWVLMPQVMKVLGPWLRRGTVPAAAPAADTEPTGLTGETVQTIRTSLPAVADAPTSTSPGLRPPAVPQDNVARQGSRPPRASRSRHAAPATFPSAPQSRSRRR